MVGWWAGGLVVCLAVWLAGCLAGVWEGNFKLFKKGWCFQMLLFSLWATPL